VLGFEHDSPIRESFSARLYDRRTGASLRQCALSRKRHSAAKPAVHYHNPNKSQDLFTTRSKSIRLSCVFLRPVLITSNLQEGIPQRQPTIATAYRYPPNGTFSVHECWCRRHPVPTGFRTVSCSQSASTKRSSLKSTIHVQGLADARELPHCQLVVTTKVRSATTTSERSEHQLPVDFTVVTSISGQQFVVACEHGCPPPGERLVSYTLATRQGIDTGFLSSLPTGIPITISMRIRLRQRWRNSFCADDTTTAHRSWFAGPHVNSVAWTGTLTIQCDLGRKRLRLIADCSTSPSAHPAPFRSEQAAYGRIRKTRLPNRSERSFGSDGNPTLGIGPFYARFGVNSNSRIC